MSNLTLIAVNKYGEEIKSRCALSTTYQQIEFWLNSTYHTVKYKQTKKGNYFILKGIRYYFKVYNTFKLIDCEYI